MTQPARRTRAQAPAPARGGRGARGGNSAAPEDGSWMKTGNTARDQSEFEAEQAKQRSEQRKQGSAFRFFLPKGEEANIIILDYSFEEVPFFYEHNLQNPEGKWNIFEPCVKEFAECPICQGHGQRGGDPRPSYYAMFLSILDTRGFTTKDNEQVPYDRKLLVVKQGQHQEFFRLFDAATKQHGTIRGMELLLARDDNGNSSSIGKPVLMEEGTMFVMNSEEDLMADFGHDAITDSSGKVVMEADALVQPYDYVKLFPRPDADALRRKYGAAPTAGSRADTGDGWDDDAPAGHGGRSRGGRDAGQRTRQSYRGAETQADDLDEEEEQAPARGSRNARGGRAAPPEQAPARQSRTRGAPAAAPAAPASAGRRGGGRGPVRGGDQF